MHYSVAMAVLKGQRTAVRSSVPENRLAIRFGSAVRLNPDPLARPTYISWTPTQNDINAEDWQVHEPDGTLVDPPRRVEGAPGRDDPPHTATGGTGAGTGWRRA